MPDFLLPLVNLYELYHHSLLVIKDFVLGISQGYVEGLTELIDQFAAGTVHDPSQLDILLTIWGTVALLPLLVGIGLLLGRAFRPIYAFFVACQLSFFYLSCFLPIYSWLSPHTPSLNLWVSSIIAIGGGLAAWLGLISFYNDRTLARFF